MFQDMPNLNIFYINEINDPDIKLGLLLKNLYLENFQLVGISARALKVKKIAEMNWNDMAPESMYNRFIKSGALSQNWDLVSKIISIFISNDYFKMTKEIYHRLMSVTAADFPHLLGPELGIAIKKKRISLI